MSNFDSGAIYFIASTLFSVMFFFLGIYYSKKLLNKIEISFILNEWLPIITTAKDTQFLELVNYDPPQNTNVYYLKAVVGNTGNIDIEKSTIHKALKVKFPKDFVIVKEKHYSNYEVDSDLKVDDNSFILNWNLLKPTETIYVELIIETKQKFTQPELEEQIDISHRIVNISKIKIFSIYPSSLSYYTSSYKTANYFLLIVTILMLMWEYLIYRSQQREISYNYPTKNLKFGTVQGFSRVNDSLVSFDSDNEQYTLLIRDVPKYFITIKETAMFSPYFWPFIVPFVMFLLLLFVRYDTKKKLKRAQIIEQKA